MLSHMLILNEKNHPIYNPARLLCIVFMGILLFIACAQNDTPETLDLAKNWRFAPDQNNVGKSEQWFSEPFDDSQWALIDAGTRWEELGYRDLDGYAWYRKRIEIPQAWQDRQIWVKFEGVNDAYELYVNGEKASVFGQANIGVASRPTFTEISDYVDPGGNNLIALRVNDWGNSGGLWRLPVIVTTDSNKVKNLFQPMSDTVYTAERLGYDLFWHDEFEHDTLDSGKWAVRGIGPRGVGYISPRAVKLDDGFLKLIAFERGDSILTGAIGTQDRFMTRYGYFECRARLQKSSGNWSAFWIQSKGIAKGEDPARYGTEIDIMEYFKKAGDDMVSHNLHWAYGPNQKTIGSLLSQVKGVGEGFHTFALEWTPEKYAFFVDGYKYYEVTTAISHIEEYLILSMELPSSMDAMENSTLPDTFVVDYVRVYKKNR
ncbi:family 16 glycosylhydrolase [candidate division KSB1 bacterium]|nr:family 16 glycosylhydrolase [candidate division KSB1 bacterium]